MEDEVLNVGRSFKEIKSLIRLINNFLNEALSLLNIDSHQMFNKGPIGSKGKGKVDKGKRRVPKGPTTSNK